MTLNKPLQRALADDTAGGANDDDDAALADMSPSQLEAAGRRGLERLKITIINPEKEVPKP